MLWHVCIYLVLALLSLHLWFDVEAFIPVYTSNLTSFHPSLGFVLVQTSLFLLIHFSFRTLGFFNRPQGLCGY